VRIPDVTVGYVKLLVVLTNRVRDTGLTLCIGTQEIRFGRKTDEIAKFSILDEETKFTILNFERKMANGSA